MKKVLTLADAGRLGGKARAKALTPEQRQEIARYAINTRWDRGTSKRDSRRARKQKQALLNLKAKQKRENL